MSSCIWPETAAAGENNPEFMSKSVSPLHFLLLTFAGWTNRNQQLVIEYIVGSKN